MTVPSLSSTLVCSEKNKTTAACMTWMSPEVILVRGSFIDTCERIFSVPLVVREDKIRNVCGQTHSILVNCMYHLPRVTNIGIFILQVRTAVSLKS